MGSFKFGGCEELIESSWRERVDRVKFEGGGVQRTRPRIDTMLLDGTELAVIAEVGPKGRSNVGGGLVT